MNGAALEGRLRAALPGVPVHRVRLPEPLVPVVIYRLSRVDRLGTLDHGAPLSKVYEVELRARTEAGLQAMTDDVLDGLGGVVRVLAEYDKRDDASSERGKYLAHVLRLQLAA